jgi:NhaP-type Na+/H+ or K+/H+ antiporter
LEAEGILLDAIGAIVAVVALEVVVSPSGFTFLASPFII